MKMNTTAPNYKGFRFPPESISHAVWLYVRFSLSIRSVEELLSQRGIVVTYETVRQWCLKFGQTSANELRCRRHSTGNKGCVARNEKKIDKHGMALFVELRSSFQRVERPV